ncbi:MAG: aspartyl-phosphate phosphatase Spo0E family protein [Firmicutes bacterium]|nr:aspartyl-phosphate phosphatase Spo0E family protein [Bacillota bacterium]
MDCQRLRRALDHTYAHYGTLTHPMVLALSRQLDEFVLRAMQQERARREAGRAASWEAHGGPE